MKKLILVGLCWWCIGQDSELEMQGAQVDVRGKLRPHMPYSVAKRFKKKILKILCSEPCSIPLD